MTAFRKKQHVRRVFEDVTLFLWTGNLLPLYVSHATTSKAEFLVYFMCIKVLFLAGIDFCKVSSRKYFAIRKAQLMPPEDRDESISAPHRMHSLRPRHETRASVVKPPSGVESDRVSRGRTKVRSKRHRNARFRSRSPLARLSPPPLQRHLPCLGAK